MKIIDFRVRPPMTGITNQIFWTNPQRRDGFNRKLGFTPAPSAQQGSIELLFTEMDAAGVSLGVVVGRVSQTLGTTSNDDVAQVCNEHPTRFVGIAGIDPLDRRAAVKEIDRAVGLGLRGVNIEPGTYRIALQADDRRLYPIYAHCEDRDLPVILMTGGNPGPDLSFTDPVTVDRVAADFPGLKIVLSHGNWPWVHQILHVAFRRPNVYVSPDMYLFDLPGSDDYVKAADTYLADQFIYASAYPFTPLEDYAKRFVKLPIRPEAMKKAVYDNAARLLKLPPHD
jgi:predicted TIM-barrel fold metal-dependent hydrolase